jgi:hypothetical protein
LIAGVVDPQCVRIGGAEFGAAGTELADAFQLSWTTIRYVKSCENNKLHFSEKSNFCMLVLCDNDPDGILLCRSYIFLYRCNLLAKFLNKVPTLFCLDFRISRCFTTGATVCTKCLLDLFDFTFMSEMSMKKLHQQNKLFY